MSTTKDKGNGSNGANTESNTNNDNNNHRRNKPEVWIRTTILIVRIRLVIGKIVVISKTIRSTQK